MAIVICKVCDKEFNVTPARVRTARCCSNACAGIWRSTFQTGENHPNWRGGQDKRECQKCGEAFTVTPADPRKFCSMDCSRAGQAFLRGTDHPNYREQARRRNRGGQHASWARAVISRDGAKCVRCGAADTELHAHHVKSYRDFPESRWELANGLTLCAPCHWAEHTALNANGVNSGNIRPGNAEDNPEPSFGRKPVEGVTTRGRAYRRWNGNCGWCGVFISKPWSDTVGKANLFCSRSCSAKHTANNRIRKSAHGSNASTSSPRESDDIVWTS